MADADLLFSTFNLSDILITGGQTNSIGPNLTATVPELPTYTYPYKTENLTFIIRQFFFVSEKISDVTA